MNHLKRWQYVATHSKKTPIIWQFHCQWATLFSEVSDPDFTAKPIARAVSASFNCIKMSFVWPIKRLSIRRLHSTRFSNWRGFMAQAPVGMLHFFTLFQRPYPTSIKRLSEGYSYFSSAFVFKLAEDFCKAKSADCEICCSLSKPLIFITGLSCLKEKELKTLWKMEQGNGFFKKIETNIILGSLL